MTIAKEIYTQLGGNKFALVTGCKNFYTNKHSDCLTMTIPKNKSKANRLEIKYNYGMDSYTMRFYRHTNARFSQKKFLEGKEAWTDAKDTEVKTFEDIYCDQLLELFTEVTGMIFPYRITFNFH